MGLGQNLSHLSLWSCNRESGNSCRWVGHAATFIWTGMAPSNKGGFRLTALHPGRTLALLRLPLGLDHGGQV